MISNMTYSHDLRIKALDYIEKGGSQVEASRIFGITVQTLCNWAYRKRQGNLPPKQERERTPYKINNQLLKEYVREHPDAYLREIAEVFDTTAAAIFYACKRLKITLKKRRLFIRKEMKRKGRSLKRN